MKKLLKNDIYLLRKNFLFWILIILGVLFTAFSIVQGVLFSNISSSMDVTSQPNGGRPGGGMMSFDMTGKSIFTSSFSLSIGFTMIVAVILALLVAQQFINGNVRNKIISGNKKSSVYLSLIISHALSGIVILLGYGVIRLIFGSIVLGYDSELAFNVTEFLYILQVFGLSLLVYIAVFSLCVWFATLTRTTGTSILCVIGFILLLSVSANIYMLIPDWTWLETLCDFNFTNMLSNTLETELAWEQWLIIIGGSVGFTVLATVGGSYLFSKQDVK